MSDNQEILILGYSGHAYVLIEAALSNGIKTTGYFDYHESKKNPYHLAYLGFEKLVDIKAIAQQKPVFPAVGDNRIRRKLIDLLDEKGIQQINIIAAHAQISKSVNMGHSNFISFGAIINAQAQIGNACIVNTGAIVEHECEFADAVHVAPGAVLAGNVRVGEGSFIGAQSVVKEGISIGNQVIIGAGSVVLKDIPHGETWVGNPAKRIK